MRTKAVNVILLLAIAAWASGQATTTGAALSLVELGFRYTPPAGLRDFTVADRRSAQDRAMALHTTNTFDGVLSLQSTTEDTAQDWKKIVIQTYPRDRLSNLNDQAAMLKVSHWLTASATKLEEPQEKKIGGFRFVVSSLQLREGNLIRLGKLYTTISKGRVIVISFTANSQEVLNRIEASANTIESASTK